MIRICFAGGTPRRRLVGLRGQLRGDLVISIAETFALVHWTSMYKSKVKTDNNFLNYSEYTRIPSSKKLELKECFSFQAQPQAERCVVQVKNFPKITQIIVNHYNYLKNLHLYYAYIYIYIIDHNRSLFIAQYDPLLPLATRMHNDCTRHPRSLAWPL